MNNAQPRFSLRKYKFGLASVMLGVFFSIPTQVSANESQPSQEDADWFKEVETQAEAQFAQDDLHYLAHGRYLPVYQNQAGHVYAQASTSPMSVTFYQLLLLGLVSATGFIVLKRKTAQGPFYKATLAVGALTYSALLLAQVDLSASQIVVAGEISENQAQGYLAHISSPSQAEKLSLKFLMDPIDAAAATQAQHQSKAQLAFKSAALAQLLMASNTVATNQVTAIQPPSQATEYLIGQSQPEGGETAEPSLASTSSTSSSSVSLSGSESSSLSLGTGVNSTSLLSEGSSASESSSSLLSASLSVSSSNSVSISNSASTSNSISNSASTSISISLSISSSDSLSSSASTSLSEFGSLAPTAAPLPTLMSPILIFDAVTEDNKLDELEATQTIKVTGRIENVDSQAVSKTILIMIGDYAESTAISAENTFSLEIEGAVLLAGGGQLSGTVTISDANQNFASSTAEHRYEITGKSTAAPTVTPTEAPSGAPTEAPIQAPSELATETPSQAPSEMASQVPTEEPRPEPSAEPIQAPIPAPSKKRRQIQSFDEGENSQTGSQNEQSRQAPISYGIGPGAQPTIMTLVPTIAPSEAPHEAVQLETVLPPLEPKQVSYFDTYYVNDAFTPLPTNSPTTAPTNLPTESPTNQPTEPPTPEPTDPPQIRELDLIFADGFDLYKDYTGVRVSLSPASWSEQLDLASQAELAPFANWTGMKYYGSELVLTQYSNHLMANFRGQFMADFG